MADRCEHLSGRGSLMWGALQLVAAISKTPCCLGHFKGLSVMRTLGQQGSRMFEALEPVAAIHQQSCGQGSFKRLPVVAVVG